MPKCVDLYQQSTIKKTTAGAGRENKKKKRTIKKYIGGLDT